MRNTTLLLTVAGAALLLPGLASAQSPGQSQGQSWTGFYAGIHGSRFRLETDAKLDVTGTIETSIPLAIADTEANQPKDLGDDTDSLGGHLGYLAQRGDWVFGGEIEADDGGDYDAPGLVGLSGGNASVIKYNGMQVRSEWAGSVTARAGRLVHPKVLVYGLGGYAMRDLSVSSGVLLTTGAAPGAFGGIITRGEDTVSGWVLGLGGEWCPIDKVGFRLEYRHTEYGEVSDTQPIAGTFSGSPALQGSGRFSADATQDEVRLGVSYHF